MPDKNIPEVLSNFRVYAEAADMLGIADVELPTLEAMTTDVMGAGSCGQNRGPHCGALRLHAGGLTWRTVSQNVTSWPLPRPISWICAAPSQVFDPASGEHK
jgi:hypothetical protein